MKQLLLILAVLVSFNADAFARGAAPEHPIPLFQELQTEGVKVEWRGRTGCCDNWVLSAPNQKVEWVATQRRNFDVAYMDMKGNPLEPDAIRKRLGMEKK